MTVESFEIVLDRISKVYYSGEKIAGQILIQADRKENIEALGVRLWGKASVSWVEGSGKSGKNKSQKSEQIVEKHAVGSTNQNVISEEESYFDRRMSILEKTGPEDIIIPQGKNAYPFEILLPAGIPSTFEGDHGQVNYHLAAIMKQSGNHDVEVKCQVSVRGILDLHNNHDALVERPEVATEKHLCCFCCKSGPIGFHFRILGKSGWMSGDKIPFSAEAYNMSNAGTVCLTLRLVQTTTYSTKEKSNVVIKELLKMKGPTISRGGTGLWNNENIDLPQNLPPSKLAGRSQIIDVEYAFDVVLEIPRSKNLVAQIPIVIGTIPIGSSAEEMIKDGLN